MLRVVAVRVAGDDGGGPAVVRGEVGIHQRGHLAAQLAVGVVEIEQDLARGAADRAPGGSSIDQGFVIGRALWLAPESTRPGRSTRP